MPKINSNQSEVFLENIARKVWAQLDYARAVETGLLEGSIGRVLVEKIDRKELEKLDQMSKAAGETIDELIVDVGELGFERTTKYLANLKKSLPGNLSLVKVALKGDPQESAKQIGKITTAITNINNVRDSFYDAIVLFGSELAKLPYSEDPLAAAEEAAEFWMKGTDTGTIEVDDKGTTLSPEEAVDQAVKAFKDFPIRDIASNKFMTWAKGIKFPDAGLLTKAAQNSFKEPKAPEGYLGKVAAFFKGQTLSSKEFANDLLDTSLEQIINKAKELEAKRAEAEAEKQQAQAAATAISTDLQALATGDATAVAGGSTVAGASQTVNVPGVGTVPASPTAVQQMTPGQRTDSADDLKGMELVSIGDLERKVTAPEDVAGMTPELAALINDDPKSKIVIFDPDEAEEVAQEAEVDPGPPAEAPTQKPQSGDVTEESWVHHHSLTDALFERKQIKKTAGWVYQSSLQRVLLSEAIMFKDVEKSIKDQGVADDKVATLARDLATRLQNQYDVIITGIPSEDVKQAAQAAAGEADNLGTLLSYLEKRDAAAERQFDRYMDDVGMSRQQTINFTQAIADGNMQAAVDVAKEAGVNARAALDAAVEMSAEIEIEEEDVSTSASSSEEKTGEAKKKRKKPGKPTQAMIDRAKKVGVEVKPTDNTDSLGDRVRRKERAEGRRPAAEKKPAKKKEPAAERQESSEEQTRTTRRVKRRGRAATQAPAFGTFTQQESVYYERGRLVEVLLGPTPQRSLLETHESSEEGVRWVELAGLKEK